ncbi:MAG: hypothetical protein H6734_04600 [Alphaproteobacteria bacterium]|nr:hypothetical protein [Alphaproteobacteria bacterium]
MIVVAAALAGNLGSLADTPVTATEDAGALLLTAGAETARVPLEGCPWRAALDRGGVLVERTCGATVQSPGVLRRVRWVPGSPPTTEADGPLLDVVAATVRGHLGRGDLDAASGELARWAGRLQYAGSPELRADLLAAYATTVAERAEQDASFGLVERAGSRVLDLLQGPPVWEPERPWDYMERLRIGPPPGNRPSPERNGYLPDSGAHRALLVRLATVLAAAGHTTAADDLAGEVLRIDPAHAGALALRSAR